MRATSVAVEAVSCVLDLLAQQLDLQCGVARTGNQCRSNHVVCLVIMPGFCEEDRSCFGNVANVCHSNSCRANGHGIDAGTRESALQIGVVLDVVAGPKNGIRNSELSQCVLNGQLRRKVRHVAELVNLENRQIGHMFQSNPLGDTVGNQRLGQFVCNNPIEQKKLTGAGNTLF